MKNNKSIFLKVTVVIIVFLVIPIIFLHSYSYQTSVSTIRDETMKNKQNQLLYRKPVIKQRIPY